ncbi:glycosyltransferase [Candidatus Saccharibacteria bacterium]|nr:glycosyltransferase [Candidatus Saccharibacteria bacterium]
MKIRKKVEIKNKGFFLSGDIKKREGFWVNKSDAKKKIILKHIIDIDTPYLKIDFSGESKAGISGVELRLISMDRGWVSEPVEFNSETLIKLRDEPQTKRYLLYINIPARAKIKIKSLGLTAWASYSILNEGDFKNDTLVVTPMYPSLNKPYSATFVYSKVKKYSENGIKTDVAVVTNSESRLYKYKYQGNQVNKISFDDLRSVIRNGNYKKILVHFLDRQIGNALLACDLDDKEVFVYCHGADVDLWNPNIFSKYFTRDHVFTQRENDYREDRLDILRTFEKKQNVKWIFNTEWNYKNSQKATGLNFDNHEIIPCVIDEEAFVFKQRTDEQKYNILVLKKMDNVRQYAVDLAVRIIMRLSDKDYFEQLHFTVAGAGDYQKELVNPLKRFKNVTIVNGFYDHDEINGVFSKNGILLAPTRYDTQGVTVGEGAMSGMVVIASKGTGVSDMLPEELGTFFDNDKIEDAVKIVDEIIKGEKDISLLSKKFHEAILNTASQKKIKKETKMIKQKFSALDRLSNMVDLKNGSPVLSIVIPAYNAAPYLKNTIKSIVDHKRVNSLEVIVVDDGSTDNTERVLKEISKESSPAVKNAIVLVQKKNGGHGSTINAALKIAKGKYFRVVDADDRLDSGALEKHLEFLEKTNADIVFTNTMHDLSVESVFRPDHKYDFMKPHVVYNFDELCEPFYGFEGYGPVLSTTSIKTDNLRKVGCHLTEKCFYVDIEYNYYMTEASRTAVLDPVDLYYYYLGRDGQSLSTESYKRNFDQHLKVMESVIKLLEKGKLSELQYEHFVRVQLHETIFHQYRIALEMFNSYKKYRQTEKVLKKYPKYYYDGYLTPGYVKRMRRFGLFYFGARKMAMNIRPLLGSVKRLVKSI